jgi:hypothetical protein
MTLPEVLELKRLPGGEWQVWVADRRRLISALGAPLVSAFCRCFIHSDRLSALLSFALLTGKAYGAESATFTRNVDTMFWFAIGTICEFEIAIDALVNALRKAQIDPFRLKGWPSVQGLQRWSKDRLPRRIRDEVAFHVDPKNIEKGVRELADASDAWLFAAGDDEQGTVGRLHLDFGRAPLLKGLAVEIDEGFVRSVQEHQGRVPVALQEMFFDALSKKGIA